MPDNESKKKAQGRIKKESHDKPSARTPEGRENQLINLSMDVVEKRLRDGTATAQEIIHFLKLGGESEKLAREKLQSENKLLLAKVEELQSRQRVEELYEQALGAMREYSGSMDEDGIDNDLEDDFYD